VTGFVMNEFTPSLSHILLESRFGEVNENQPVSSSRLAQSDQRIDAGAPLRSAGRARSLPRLR
jgi:hypothetical protein